MSRNAIKHKNINNSINTITLNVVYKDLPDIA